MDADTVRGLGARIADVPGVVGVLLGGSRARGEHTERSDWDLGVYYSAPLDTGALGALARRVAGPDASVSGPGDWGPWVDGGAWLRIDGVAVDWIYRELGRVERSWRDAQAGRFAYHAQWGHPLGVPDFSYAGEVALGVVLADPGGRLTELHRETQHYPPALADALVAGLDEAGFLLGVLRKSIDRADAVWAASALSRVVLLCVHALQGRAGRWLVNEKGALAAAAGLPIAPSDLVDRAGTITGRIGTTPQDIARAVGAADALLADVRDAVDQPSG